MAGRYEWDEKKKAANLAKHGLLFEFADRIFADPELIIVDASRQEDGEMRQKALGRVDGDLYVAVYTQRGLITRLISVRRMNPNEEKTYGDRQIHARP